MDLSFLPSNVLEGIKKVDILYLTEIRLRFGVPVVVKYKNNRFYLTKEGVKKSKTDAIILGKNDIENTVYKLSDYSLYCANDKIKENYLTTDDGIRIGLAGECVYENDKLLTVKNFTSLCVRIPHFIEGAGKYVKSVLFKENVFNTLIISLPGYGKTTILKDLADSLSVEKNVLLVDERGELSARKEINADVIKFSNKIYALKNGIRSLAPDIVITDELSLDIDAEFVKKAIQSGVKVIASIHGNDINYIKNELIERKLYFERYVLLSDKIIGKISSVYDKDFQIINEQF